MKRQVPLLLAAGLLLLGLIYGSVRGGQNASLARETRALEMARGRAQTLVSGIDPTLLRTRPAPEPDLPGWLAANPLKKFAEKVESNQPGQSGVNLRLRRLEPLEVSALFSQFTQVGLRIPRLILSDADGDGNWTMDVLLETTSAP